MLQATVCDCLALDPFAFEEDGLGSSEVDLGLGKMVAVTSFAFMVAQRFQATMKREKSSSTVER